MNNLNNLKSYDDVENLDRFTEQSFAEYCKLKLSTCREDVDFIKRNIYKGTKMNVCEIGGGNGKLLYSLEREGILNKGYNYEVSESRYRFAQKFGEWMNSSCVVNRNQNILEAENLEDKFDCIVAVDIVTQLITNLYDEAEEEYFSWISDHLNGGGYAYFELQNFAKEISYIKNEKTPLRNWEEFPEDDPFQYGLYKLNLDKDGNIVYDKLFYERKSGKMVGFTDVIKPYAEEEILKILQKYGMQGEIHYYYKSPGDLLSKLYLVLARKVARQGE